MSIQAYIDDSGITGTDPVFVLAGFIAPAERWAQFSDAWTQCLKQPPSIRYLKMNEAVKLDGEFRFWKPDERDNKLLECVHVFNQFRPYKGIYFLSDLIAWKQIMPKMKVKTLSNPHFHGFNAIIAGVCNDALDAGIDEEIEIIFDQHVIFGPRVSLWYPAVKEAIELTNPERVESVRKVLPSAPMFRDDQKFVPLQAADVLAWFMRKAFEQRIPGPESAWRYPKPTGFEWFSEKLLRNFPPPSRYSTMWGHERIAGIQKMSEEMRNDPVLANTIVKWQRLLGIKPEE